MDPTPCGTASLAAKDEPRITEVSAGRRWTLDGGDDEFRRGHLFDPHTAVNASAHRSAPAPVDGGLRCDPQGATCSGSCWPTGVLIKDLLGRGSLERCLITAPGT